MEKAPRDPRAVFDKWQSPVQETLRQRTRMTARGAWTAGVEMRMMAPRSALVAQLDRVLPSEGRGRGFESRRMRQIHEKAPGEILGPFWFGQVQVRHDRSRLAPPGCSGQAVAGWKTRAAIVHRSPQRGALVEKPAAFSTLRCRSANGHQAGVAARCRRVHAQGSFDQQALQRDVRVAGRQADHGDQRTVAAGELLADAA